MVTKEQALEILEKFDFFQGQRAGRELWSEKPFDVQEQDLAGFSRDVALLKEYISTTDTVQGLVPPCKVGDMLYKPYCGKILEYKVVEFSFRIEGLLAHTQSKQTGGRHPVWCASIGKTYFIHRHEAEAVLAAWLKGGE